MKMAASLMGIVMLTLVFAASAMAGNYGGKKILLIDSYHEGYAWSDGLVAGAKSVLDGKGADLKIVRMDTKRNSEETFKQEAALKVKAEIEAFKPDVVIAADDSAAKYVLAPFYKNAGIPFVFCGLNWDAAVYGLPYDNATGMVEVTMATELLNHLKKFAKGNRVGFVADDNNTMQKEVKNYKEILKLDMTTKLVKTMADWKQAIADIQGQVDMLIIGNPVGIQGWEEQDGLNYLSANTKIPTGAVDDHMAKFALLGFTKLPGEQGRYAAETALKILDGTAPTAIPVAKNKEGRLTVNVKIAKSLGVELPYELISSANQVFE